MNRFLALLLLLPSLCFGQTQGAHRLGQVLVKGNNIAANVGPYANIKVCVVNTSCNQLATIYADPSLTVPMANPVIADGNGNYNYYVSSGCVDEQISTPGQGSIPVHNVCPFNGINGGGGGAPPEGSANEINAKLDNSAFQGSGLFTTADHSYLFTPAPQWAQYPRNSPRLSYCNNSQCSNAMISGQDTPLLNGSNNPIGFGKLATLYRSNLYTALGTFDGFSGDPNQPGGGDYYGSDVRKNVFHTPSISQSVSMNTFCGKAYDCAGIYSYMWYHGGLWGASDEGPTNFRANGGNFANRLAQFTVTGSPAVGATTVTSTGIGNVDELLVGGFVFDAYASPIATGNITAYNTATHMLTVTPGSVTPATSLGTTTGAISVPVPDAVNGTSVTVTVHITNGSAFTIGSTNPVYFACANPELESVIPTTVGTVDGSGNQTITANFFHGHAAGCTVAQGGTAGILDLTADQQPSFWKTSYFVFAAPDNSHIMEVTYLSGGRGFINNFRHNFGGGQNTVTNATITGNGTTITACGLGQSAYNFAGQYVQISGATPSSFNGTYTASALNQNLCATMAGTASGTATGATIAVGGAINSPDGLTKGPGGFNVWTTARVRQLGTTATTVNGVTTNNYNNIIYFYPNNMTWVNGHGYGVLDDMQGAISMISARGNDDTPPTGLGVRWMSSEFAGNGVAGINYDGFSIINGNPYSLYKGGNGTGQLDAITGLSIEGPYIRNIFTNAPVQGGYALYIEKGPNTGNPNLPSSFFPLFVAGPGGGSGGFTINYDPNTGKTNITSGTGNGVFTALTMTPTDFTMAASLTGTFTLQGQTYKLNGLSGTGTRAVTVDSTGTLGTSTLGTVTSVGLTVPSWATGSGTITSSGTFNLSLPAFVGSGASHAPGIVPDPGPGAGTTRFLNEDGTWKAPTTTGFTGTCAPTTTITVSNGLITGCS